MWVCQVAIDAIQYKEHGLQREPLEAANSFKARIYRWQQSHLQQMFSIPMFDIPYDSFKKEIPKIEEMMIRLRKRNRQNRRELTEIFIKIVGGNAIRQKNKSHVLHLHELSKRAILKNVNWFVSNKKMDV